MPLRRALGLRTIVSTSAGLAFAVIEYLAIAGLIVYVAGDSAWIAILVAGSLMIGVWGFYSELNGMFPTAAAIRLFMKNAMDDRVALSITFTYMLTIVLVIAADAFIVGSAIAHVLGESGAVIGIYIALLIGAATVANLRGVRVAGLVEDGATYTVLAVTVAVAFAGLAKFHGHLNAPLQPLHGHSFGDFVQAVALGVFLYSAFEWVTTSSEEVREPRLIPRGMLIAIGLLFVTCALTATAMSHLLTPAQLSSAYPQLFLGQHVWGRAGVYLMMAVTALTAVNTFNGGFITASRFIYAIAREGNLPLAVAKLNSNAVPWVPIVGLAGISVVVALLVAVTHSWQVLVGAGAVLEAMIYGVAGWCVSRLRAKMPDRDRPFRLLGSRWLAVAGVAVFGFLALAAGISVDGKTNPAPLVVVVVCGGAATLYVLAFLPKVRAAEEARRSAAGTRRPNRPQPAGPDRHPGGSS
jgi:basic amino acid/polyamine antiporter, APA family